MASQVVLITGCSRGIGLETALYLAKDPQRRFKVYATMRNMATNQEDLKTQAGKAFDDTLFIRELDVTKQDTIDKTVKEIVDKEGKIDVLVNNAAFQNDTWWQTAPMETFYDIMEVNYFGCVRMSRAVVPYMKEKRSGKILQISSLLGIKAPPVLAQNTSSKFALEGFSESIAPPLRKFNVWVSIIELGFVATALVQQFAGTDANSFWKAIASTVPDADERDIVVKMLTSDPDIVAGLEMQQPRDIAECVQEVILSTKPDFRYQSSKTINEIIRVQCLKDPTGNSIMDTWMKQ
ncbi:retinol dehydrogenase 8-like [Amphiura filiformis]|uniref:retinol dehydrogenase 8-like n=1 Tax=Amphiura filiformis TaxID=82378 RepID=UPI003B217F3F